MSLSSIDALLNPGSEQIETISLLLFQAIMFASSAHASEDTIRAAGYASRAEAKRTFYQRARVSAIKLVMTCAVRLRIWKLLYNLASESNPIVVIQALLLLAYGSDDEGFARGKTHWMAIAASLCYRIGLSRYPNSANLARISVATQRLWKRV